MTGIADLMTPAPTRWGLHSDPILWQMMADKLSGVTLPDDRATLLQIITSTFQELTTYTPQTTRLITSTCLKPVVKMAACRMAWFQAFSGVTWHCRSFCHAGRDPCVKLC